MDSLEKRIKESGLIEKGDKVLVGLSGGADSMCLTRALWSLADEIGFEIATAHVNHNIRGEAAKRDEKAAREFAEGLGIAHYSKSEDVIGYAEEKGISEELAGRELRYAFFAYLCKEHGYTKIATAHNKNDNAETIMMNFMRGSALSGLCGIPKRRGNIIRPLLDITRAQIEEYCAKYALPYVTDGTNLEQIYTRNKVRLSLIPQIEESFNPNIMNTLTRNAQLIKEDCDFLDKCADEFYRAKVKDNAVGLESINKAEPSIARRVIMHMLDKAMNGLGDISADSPLRVIRLCKSGKTGKSVDLPNGVSARIEYDRLIIDANKAEIGEFEYELKEGESVYVRELDKTFRLMRCDKAEKDGALYFSGGSEFKVRNRRNGDVFYPVGMSGRKKLKDFFIDAKIPREQRMRTAIITADGEIACIIGKRADKRYSVNKEKAPVFKIITEK